jgi:uncharacterized damage-inducible protein DinB
MWHGPAVMELLRSVEAEQAARRPIASAHSIWELTLHMTTWAEIARQRLDGLSLEYPDVTIDWPPMPANANAQEWTAALQRLSDAYEALALAVRELPEEGLRARAAGNEYSVETMLCGVVEHGVYHGGQIAILMKADRQRQSTTN